MSEELDEYQPCGEVDLNTITIRLNELVREQSRKAYFPVFTDQYPEKTKETLEQATFSNIGLDSFDVLNVMWKYEEMYKVTIDDRLIGECKNLYEVACFLMNLENGVQAS